MRMMSEASFATSVPAMFIEKPTSAAFRAGASLVPSPVTATVSPISLRRRTRTRLSSGEERARTCSLGMISRCSCLLIFLNSGPSIARPPGVKMPHSFAIAFAVLMLSPVTMRGNTPAMMQSATDSETPLRSGSWIPTRPRNVMSLQTSSNTA